MKSTVIISKQLEFSLIGPKIESLSVKQKIKLPSSPLEAKHGDEMVDDGRSLVEANNQSS